jgi:hypothetical protein
MLLASGLVLSFLFQNCSNWNGKVLISGGADALSANPDFVIADPSLDGADDPSDDSNNTDLPPVLGEITLTLIGTDQVKVDIKIEDDHTLTNEISIYYEGTLVENGFTVTVPAGTGLFTIAAGDIKIVDNNENSSSNTNPVSLQLPYGLGITNVTAGIKPLGTSSSLCANTASLKTTTATITFEKADSQCAWSQNGNLSGVNEKIRARFEQSKTLSLPSGSIACSMNFNFDDNQYIKYDDQLLLTYNGFVFATTDRSLLEQLENKGFINTPLYQYDWSKIVGNGDYDWSPNGTDPMCLDSRLGNTCTWPVSETLGTIKVTVDPVQIQYISDLTGDQLAKTFKLITFGDDNTTDCTHEAISYTVEITYY